MSHNLDILNNKNIKTHQEETTNHFESQKKTLQKLRYCNDQFGMHNPNSHFVIVHVTSKKTLLPSDENVQKYSMITTVYFKSWKLDLQKVFYE